MNRVIQFIAKNQFLLIDSDKDTITFQSYKSIICTLDKKNNIITIYEDWEYSNTTKKYLYEFLSIYIGIELTSQNKTKELQNIIENGKINNYKIVCKNAWQVILYMIKWVY